MANVTFEVIKSGICNVLVEGVIVGELTAMKNGAELFIHTSEGRASLRFYTGSKVMTESKAMVANLLNISTISQIIALKETTRCNGNEAITISKIFKI